MSTTATAPTLCPIACMKRIISARRNLIGKNRVLGALSLRFKNSNIKIDTECPTAWTNGTDIGFNPEFVESLTNVELMGLIAHEVLHCVFLHHTRRGNRKPFKWNIATDYVINAILQKQGFALPKDGCFRDLSHLTAEQAYALVDAEMDDPPQVMMLSGGGEGDGEGEEGEGEGQGKSKGGKDKKGNGNGWGEIRDAVGKDGLKADPSELKTIEEAMKVAVTQILESTPSCGKEFGGLLREIVNIEKASSLNWTDVLRDFMTNRTNSDVNWNRPNRRFSDEYIPSNNVPDLGTIVIAIDTSGSMDDKQLEKINAEVNDIFASFKCKLVIIPCDTRVVESGVQEYTSEDAPVEISAPGGGGTAFSPVFKYVKDNDLEVEALVFFTDLDCSDYGPTPDYPVLWIYTNPSYYRKPQTPPFGDVVVME